MHVTYVTSRGRTTLAMLTTDDYDHLKYNLFLRPLQYIV